jgi:hypothetical protein
MCEWDADKWTTVWVLCNHVRVHLEVMLDHPRECSCGRWPYCKCKTPWNKEQETQLSLALIGQPYDPNVIQTLLENKTAFGDSETQLIKQIVRHGLLCQIWDKCNG